MKRGVEARHLRQRRLALEQGSDRRQVVRLVQRRERLEGAQRVERLRVDAQRPVVGRPAVHHPMADADQAVACIVFTQHPEQVFERAFVAEPHTLAPRLFRHDACVGVLGDETRRGEEALDLAAQLQLEIVAARHEERELQA